MCLEVVWSGERCREVAWSALEWRGVAWCGVVAVSWRIGCMGRGDVAGRGRSSPLHFSELHYTTLLFSYLLSVYILLTK